MTENELAKIAFECGLKIHRTLGPGLFENVYEECLLYELGNRELKVERQYSLPLKYENLTLPLAYKMDLLVENKLVIELKKVEIITDLHFAQ